MVLNYLKNSGASYKYMIIVNSPIRYVFNRKNRPEIRTAFNL